MVALFSGGDNTSASQAPTAEPRATPAAPVSESVKEGCAASVMLKMMFEDMDIPGLETLGPDLMRAMVSTSDGILNVTGRLIAQAMSDFSEDAIPANLNRMMDGFDAYIETCQNLKRS